MKKGLFILATAVIALAPLNAPAAVVRGGFVGGPRFYGGWYGPYWGSYWAPYWGPGYFAPYNAYPNIGEVKLDTKVRDAQVFINGAYSGTTHENRTMRLRPGTYNIEIREGGQTPFSQKIFVVAGKTMHLHPML